MRRTIGYAAGSNVKRPHVKQPLLLFTACTLLAGSVGAAELRTLKVQRERGHIIVGSETYIDAPPQAVYEILADYEGFQDISDVFDETRIIERDEAGNGLVYSRVKGCVLLFCATIERVEELTVDPGRKITAVALPEQSDVEFSTAHWVFEEEAGGTRIDYQLDFKPDFWVPPVLGPLIIRAKLHSRAVAAANRVEELANARLGSHVAH